MWLWLLRFLPFQFFLARIDSLQTEGVIHPTDCKSEALWFVIHYILCKEACACLRLKDGWTVGSGHGPQCGTWALVSGRTNTKTRGKDSFIVDTGLCYLQPKHTIQPPTDRLQIKNIKSALCVGKATTEKNINWHLQKVITSNANIIYTFSFFPSCFREQKKIKHHFRRHNKLIKSSVSEPFILVYINLYFLTSVAWWFEIYVLSLRLMLLFELETLLSTRCCSTVTVCHQRVSLCRASFISDMK